MCPIIYIIYPLYIYNSSSAPSLNSPNGVALNELFMKDHEHCTLHEATVFFASPFGNASPLVPLRLSRVKKKREATFPTLMRLVHLKYTDIFPTILLPKTDIHCHTLFPYV